MKRCHFAPHPKQTLHHQLALVYRINPSARKTVKQATLVEGWEGTEVRRILAEASMCDSGVKTALAAYPLAKAVAVTQAASGHP
jgi:hypothetical protein